MSVDSRGTRWVGASALAVGGWLLTAATVSGAPIVGQVQTFEDGTTQGWTAGGGPQQAVPPVPPGNVSSGGPSGLDDAYLLITAIGGASAPGSRLTAFNVAQWAGDYTTAGIGAIAMDVRNFGDTEVALRLALFSGPPSTAPVHYGFTTAGREMAAGGGWTRVTFALNPESLTMLLGSSGDLLAAVTEVRLFHGTTFPPQPIVAILGVDNITAQAAATAVPAPGTAAVFVIGLAAALVRRRD